MKAGCRPQYHRIRRMVQMVREGSETGCLSNGRDFSGRVRRVSAAHRRLRPGFPAREESTPLEYDEARHGFRLTDETFSLPPVRISRREAFGFALARKLLAHYEATPLHMDMRAVLEQDRRVAGGRHQHRAGLAEPSVSACCPKTACGPIPRKCGRKWRANAGKRCGRTIRASPHGFRGTACPPCTCSPIVR